MIRVIQDTGNMIQDTKYRNTGYRKVDTENTIYRKQDTENRIQKTKYRKQDTGNKMQETRYKKHVFLRQCQKKDINKWKRRKIHELRKLMQSPPLPSLNIS